MKKYEDGILTGEGEDVEKFTVHYTNGTEKVIEKGFFCKIETVNGEETLNFIMAHCSGKDLATIIYGCAQLGVELGYFD